MLCQKCKKNPATVHLVKLVNGEKSDIWLCEECARKISDVSFGIPVVSMSENSFKNILGDFFDTLDKTKESEKTKEINVDVICKKCGLTYSKFKETGKVGCGECYSSFKDLIDEDIKKVQGSTSYMGKYPDKSNENEMEFENVSIDKLKEELNKAIAKEAYEKAAIIRDKIKAFKQMDGGMEAYEKLDS